MQSLLEGAQEWHTSARCHQQTTGTWAKFRVYCGHCHVGLLPYFHVINDTNQPTVSLPAYTYVYIIIYHDLCSALDLHVHGVLFIPGLLYLYVWCINDCLIVWLWLIYSNQVEGSSKYVVYITQGQVPWVCALVCATTIGCWMHPAPTSAQDGLHPLQLALMVFFACHHLATYTHDGYHLRLALNCGVIFYYYIMMGMHCNLHCARRMPPTLVICKLFTSAVKCMSTVQ